MMMMEVQAVHTVKPSSPTPNHLRRHVLSFLDQLSPPIFIPVILFYPKDEVMSNPERCDTIRRALSKALTRFYPLAGRVKKNSYVDCNDEGAPYAEVRVRCPLVSILENPTQQVMNKLLPIEAHIVSELGMAVQVSMFDCGGLAISLCISHKIADGQSFFTFLNCWAAIARGSTVTVTPHFDSSSLFPPIDITECPENPGITTNITTKRFVFDAVSIAAIRAKYTDNNSQDRRPTRVEALSAFIWRRYVASTTKTPGEHSMDNKIFSVLHAVNLRRRMEPVLSERNFGNISSITLTMPSTDLIEEGRGHEVVNEVREAIRQVDADHIKKIQQSGVGHLKFMKERYAALTKYEVVTFCFSSICRFPMYESDFGWGKPVWVGVASLPINNLVVFLDTKSGGGIEALCHLKEEEMPRFEKDKELLSYASPLSKL